MFKEAILAFFTLMNSNAPAQQAQPAKAAVKPVRVAVAQKMSAVEVVDRIQKFYDKTDRLSAKFRQHYTNDTFGKTTSSDGKVYIKKPGKMRWDYYGKMPGKKKKQQVKSFISDGDKLWAVEHDNKQVFKKSLEEDLLPVAVTFLYGKGDLKKDFTPTLETKKKFGKQPGEVVLKLTPKTPSAQYKTLWLVVNTTDFRVRRSIVLEASGNTNAFTFYEPDVTKQVSDDWFWFNEKKLKGYRIVEPDKAQ